MEESQGKASLTAEIILNLVDENEPLTNKQLAELSDLSKDDLNLFNETWEKLSTERKSLIMSHLKALAEDSVELDFDAVFKHRLTDLSEEIRFKAIEGLWESENPTLITPLIKIMRSDSSSRIRCLAAMTLGRYAMLAEHRKIHADYTPLLCKALLDTYKDSDDIDLKKRAIEAVSPLSVPQVEQVISEAYNSDDTTLKAASLYAMGRNCASHWVNYAIKELSASSPELRYEAAGACGELGEDIAVPYLIEVIDDDDIDVQIAAIEALGKIGGEEAQECLQACLNNDSEMIKEAAEQALADLNVMKDPGSISWFDLEDAEDD